MRPHGGKARPPKAGGGATVSEVCRHAVNTAQSYCAIRGMAGFQTNRGYGVVQLSKSLALALE